MSLLCDVAAKRAKVDHRSGHTSREASGDMKGKGPFSKRHEEDVKKLKFTLEAIAAADPFQQEVSLHRDVEHALEWQAQRTPQQVMQEREETITSLERAGDMMWREGICDFWLKDADEGVRSVSATVNGIILEDLCRAVSYEDSACVELFRSGGDLYGQLPVTSIGPPKECALSGDIGELWRDRARSNESLIQHLRENEYHQELHQLTEQDAALGRMTKPIKATDFDLAKVRLVPRFGVEQGLRQDGSLKIRSIDNMSWCLAPDDVKRFLSKKKQKELSINGCTAIPVEIRHDHIDELAIVMRQFRRSFGDIPWLYKADVDAAFRRVPLNPEHRWAAAIVYIHEGTVWVSLHTASPFGSASAVYNWERVGAMICTLARRMLHLATLRYVDDFFGVERSETVKHAMYCLARLVRVLLGTTAIADRKLEFGASLVVLGITVAPSTNGFKMAPAVEKAQKCSRMIETALRIRKLSSGDAEKLAGRLSWATQYMFHRLGRAMLRPIFDQKYSRDGSLSKQLCIALEWWGMVLQQSSDLTEEHFWEVPSVPVARLFVDARGNPARCAAVLYKEGRWLYTDGKPIHAITSALESRKDAQIMALESVAIALGLCTFADELRGTKVVVYSDNKSAEAATRKGSAKSWDHCCIIHSIWTLALRNKMWLWIERVCSADNISDLPSREEYALMNDMHIEWREPVIAELFLESLRDGCTVAPHDRHCN